LDVEEHNSVNAAPTTCCRHAFTRYQENIAMTQGELDFRGPVVALERWGGRIAGLCVFGQTGIGWIAAHHCVWCYVFTRESDA